jgi:precorrin-3B synthase
MTAARARKGWCPSLLSPMQSGDGWLARVKPTGARLSADETRAIAVVARRHGNGHIDLTSRANLQIRGLSPESAEAFAHEIIAQGLARPEPAIEAIRNVMASPLGPDDPTAAFDSHAVAAEIEAMLSGEPALAALPSKFGFLVDGGGLLPLASIATDIMVRAQDSKIAVGFDGGAFAAICEVSAVADTVRILALTFLELAAGRVEHPTRMRSLVMAVGADALFETAGLRPVPRVSTPAPAQPPIGFMPYRDQSSGVFGVGLPFGRMEAEALMCLADLSERFGDGTLRLTPWRTLLLSGIPVEDVTPLTDAIPALRLIADQTDPRLHIFACVGRPACQSASVDARADASLLAASQAARGRVVHVSGCAKGCAHHGSAALTLVGRDGLYDLVKNGSPSDAPVLTGLTIQRAISAIEQERGRQ